MPRKARIDDPGAPNHIIVRGIERRNIFKDDTDSINFLDRLGKVISEIGRNICTRKARSLFCYWVVRELGLTMAELAQS